MNSDPQPLLTAAAASSPPSSPSSPPTTSGGSSSLSGVEVGSFPCLAHPLLQRPLAALDTAWNTIRDRVPPLRPLLLYAEDHELRGLMLVLMLVTAFVHVGMTRVLQPIEWSWLRVTLQLLFAAQALVGYASLFLFRACDPGFLPINEGAIDAETAELLSRPEYSGTGLVPTREFAGEYLEWEVAAEAAQREADEAAGIFDHLDAELYGLAPPPLLQEWCRTCRVWRPPRAAHCYKCQRCVRRSDHHCTALGACVGQRNHRFFLLFLTLLGSGACTLAVGSLFWLLQELWSGVDNSRALYAFLALLVCGGASSLTLVAAFHWRLLLWDVTMREKYGRKRVARHAARIGRRQKWKEVWTQIGSVPLVWVGASVAARKRREERRAAAGGYAQPSAQHVAASPLKSPATSPAISNLEQEEHVDCVPTAAPAPLAVVHVDNSGKQE